MSSRCVSFVAAGLFILSGIAFFALSCVDKGIAKSSKVTSPFLGTEAPIPTASPKGVLPSIPAICPTPTTTWPCYYLLNACSEEECYYLCTLRT